MRSSLLLLIISVCCSLAANASEYAPTDGPLRVRPLSPLMQIYGIPRSIGARVANGFTESTFNLEISNNFQSAYRDGTYAFFDGETWVNSYRFRSGLRDDMEWGFELPYVVHTNGNMDSIVDEFHELFGLPDGQRSIAPRNRLDYLIRSGGEVYADFNDGQRGIGDLRGYLGYQVFANPTQAFAIRTQLKIPTGDARKLTGSEAVDLAVWGEFERVLQLKDYQFNLSLSGGVTYLGEGEIMPQDQESWVGFGHLGLQMPIGERFAFYAQVDARSTVLETANPLLGQGGVLGTLGGRIGLTKRYWVDLSLIEDLADETAADVVFQILVGTKF